MTGTDCRANHVLTDDQIEKLVLANKAGKQIQERRRGARIEWSDSFPGPYWDFVNYEYRVKPQPETLREYCVRVDSNGTVLGGHRSYDDFTCGDHIKLREV